MSKKLRSPSPNVNRLYRTDLFYIAIRNYFITKDKDLCELQIAKVIEKAEKRLKEIERDENFRFFRVMRNNRQLKFRSKYIQSLHALIREGKLVGCGNRKQVKKFRETLEKTHKNDLNFRAILHFYRFQKITLVGAIENALTEKNCKDLLVEIRKEVERLMNMYNDISQGNVFQNDDKAIDFHLKTQYSFCDVKKLLDSNIKKNICDKTDAADHRNFKRLIEAASIADRNMERLEEIIDGLVQDECDLNENNERADIVQAPPPMSPGMEPYEFEPINDVETAAESVYDESLNVSPEEEEIRKRPFPDWLEYELPKFYYQVKEKHNSGVLGVVRELMYYLKTLEKRSLLINKCLSDDDFRNAFYNYNVSEGDIRTYLYSICHEMQKYATADSFKEDHLVDMLTEADNNAAALYEAFEDAVAKTGKKLRSGTPPRSSKMKKKQPKPDDDDDDDDNDATVSRTRRTPDSPLCDNKSNVRSRRDKFIAEKKEKYKGALETCDEESSSKTIAGPIVPFPRNNDNETQCKDDQQNRHDENDDVGKKSRYTKTSLSRSRSPKIKHKCGKSENTSKVKEGDENTSRYTKTSLSKSRSRSPKAKSKSPKSKDCKEDDTKGDENTSRFVKTSLSRSRSPKEKSKSPKSKDCEKDTEGDENTSRFVKTSLSRSRSPKEKSKSPKSKDCEKNTKGDENTSRFAKTSLSRSCSPKAKSKSPKSKVCAEDTEVDQNKSRFAKCSLSPVCKKGISKSKGSNAEDKSHEDDNDSNKCGKCFKNKRKTKSLDKDGQISRFSKTSLSPVRTKKQKSLPTQKIKDILTEDESVCESSIYETCESTLGKSDDL